MDKTNQVGPMAICHPLVDRRLALRVGASGLLGFGMNHLQAIHLLGAATKSSGSAGGTGKARAVIYIFY